MAGDAGDLVDATRKADVVVAMIGARGLLQFLERFDCADDGAMLVVNRNGANADRNFISALVVQEADGLDGMRRLNRAGDGAVFVAEFATRLIAVQQGFRDAGVADDFVAQVPGNALGAVAPEDDFFCMSITHKPAGRLSRMLRQMSGS